MLVAHQMSTIKDADNIFVLQHGRILQEGTHRQLTVDEGLYGNLWRAQTDEGNGSLRRYIAAAPANGKNGNGRALVKGMSHA